MKCSICGKDHKDIDCPIIGKIAENLKNDIDREITDALVRSNKEKLVSYRNNDI
jgi:hypothetical protein